MPAEELPHPMQPIYKDVHGTYRFKPNKIVRFLLNAGPFDLNYLAIMNWDDEDREQLAMLIGYPVSAFGGLNYTSDGIAQRADEIVDRLLMEEPDDR